MKTIFANFTTFNLMKECFNISHTLYEMYANNEDAILMPYFAIVGTCRCANAYLQISLTGASILIH